MPYLLLILTVLAASCSQQQKDTHSIGYSWEQICSRDEGLPQQRFPVYRAKIPSSWIRHDPSPEESIADTMQPICHFHIDEGLETLRLTIHNFPSRSIQERISPAAQIARWKQQFDSLAPGNVLVTPISSGGFTGFSFEGTGILQGKATTVIGWSMQMATEQYQNFQKNTFKERQRRADYTIKAQGPPKIMEQHKDELHLFARSFELIEEIPSH